MTEKRIINLKSAETLLKKLHYEIKLIKQLNEIKTLRHAGLFNEKVIQEESNEEGSLSENGENGESLYDWIVDIDFLSNIATNGWPVIFSKNFLKNSPHNVRSTISPINEITPKNKESDSLPWEGAIVAVVGLYDKGKTFVLNNLSNSNLPSGKKVNTKGLSFKYVDVDKGTKLILLDTAGSYAPVKVEDNMSIIEREATEHFLLELVFDVADYFIFVVNDFTSLDQRFLDKLSRALQSSVTKTFREVIVIHNFKEVES